MEFPRVLSWGCCFLMLSTLVTTLDASVAIGPSRVDPNNPGMCVDADTNKTYPIDSSWQIAGTCGQITCVKRAEELYLYYMFCGSSQASPPCRLVEDLELTYPSCCPRVVCDQQLDNKIDVEDYGNYDDLYMMSSDETVKYINFENILNSSEQEEDKMTSYDGIEGKMTSYEGKEGKMTSSEESQDYLIDWDLLFSQITRK